MKKVLLFAIALSVASPAYAQYAAINHVEAGSSNGNTVTTGTVNMTGADLLVACVSSHADVADATVTDSSSNTYSSVGATALTGNAKTKLFYKQGPSVGSSMTFTASTSTGYPSIVVMGFSGSTTSPLDRNAAGSTNATTTSIQPGSITPRFNDELVVSCLGTFDDETGLAINSSFATPYSVATVNGQHFGGAGSYKIQTTAAAVNPTWSVSNSIAMTSDQVSFRSNISGGGGGGEGHVASDCTQEAVEEQFLLATEDNATVVIPDGSCEWTLAFSSAYPGNEGNPNLRWDVPSGGVLRCAGSAVDGERGTNDATVIEDGMNRNGGLQSLINFGVTDTLEIYGCSFTNDAGLTNNEDRSEGLLNIVGSLDTSVKIHHNNYTTTIGNSFLYLLGHPRGVIYENTFLQYGTSYAIKIRGNGDGDDVWAEPTDFGSDRFLFIEDNYIETNGGHTMEDAYAGARFVGRKNEMDCSGFQNHGAQAASRIRGIRAYEIYQNDAAHSTNCGGNSYAFNSTESGTSLMWGNAIGDGLYTHYGPINIERAGDHENHGAYNAIPPAAFSYCMPLAAGTVNTSAVSGGTQVTVTWVSGTTFNTGWLTIDGGGDDYNGVIIHIGSYDYQVKSISSTTSMVVVATSNAASSVSLIASQSGIAYQMGSNIDEHVGSLTGSRCLDAPGNGVGDLLSGSFSSVVNEDNLVMGMPATYASANWWPRQQLEPYYEWSNTGYCLTGFPSCPKVTPSTINGGVMVQGYNFYTETNGHVGAGTSLPGTCTVNDLYTKTDEGEWDSTHDGTDGKTYWCQSTNTWVASYGAHNTSPDGGTAGLPYTYPHPLRASSPDSSPDTPSGGGVSRLRMRVR